MVEVGKMNRIKFFLISFILLMQTSVFADFQLPIRDYNQTSQTVYLDTLGAISASGFKIIEMQSKNGLVYFSSQDIQYYAKVFNAGSSATLKITPISSNYKDEILPINVIFNLEYRKLFYTFAQRNW